MRVLIGAAMLWVLVELLVNEVLIVLFERGAIGRIGDSFILGQQVVKVQLLFLHRYNSYNSIIEVIKLLNSIIETYQLLFYSPQYKFKVKVSSLFIFLLLLFQVFLEVPLGPGLLDLGIFFFGLSQVLFVDLLSQLPMLGVLQILPLVFICHLLHSRYFLF